MVSIRPFTPRPKKRYGDKMRLLIATLLVGILAGCAEMPGPDATVKNERSAIELAKVTCKPVREKSETDTNFALRITEYEGRRWEAAYLDGAWETGSGHKFSNAPPYSKKCHDIHVKIDAKTGKSSECGECIVVG